MLQIAIINGPNLNLIGTREVDVYGGQSLDEFYKVLQQEFPQVSFEFYQSNVEGEIINFLHSCRGRVKGIVFNGGAYTHTSIAIPDAIAAINIPTIEVHISNIYAREEFRKHSYTAAKCVGCITGLGLRGYTLATQYFVDTLIAP
ncbi:MAG: type II 3-dehydroquinate dehydratase [Bacteroidetes bacterium]|nr:type II 3-dehydroquinate dehydratase [Bacteroidota bacterium]